MPAVACAQVLRYVLLRHSRVAARCSTVRSNVPWDMKGWRAPTRFFPGSEERHYAFEREKECVSVFIFPVSGYFRAAVVLLILSPIAARCVLASMQVRRAQV